MNTTAQDNRQIEIFQLAAEPTIDGELDAVWEAMPVHSVNQLEAGGTREGNADYDPTFRAGWKNNKLFFFFDIMDDVHIFTPTANAWEQDYVIIFMNFNATHETDETYGDFPAWWFRTTFPTAGLEPVGGGRGPTGWPGLSDFPAYDMVAKRVGSSHILEIVFDLNDANWETPQVLGEGVTFGFDIEAGDVDADAVRKHQQFWSEEGNDTNWANPSGLGVAVIRDEALGTNVADMNVAAGVKMYPNPAQNTLHFSNIETISRIIIRNITGQIIKVVDARNNTSVDISELNSGIYLVTFEGRYLSTQKLIVR